MGNAEELKYLTVSNLKEAIKNALEVIELWIEDAQKAGEPVPPPMVAV